MLIRSGRAEDLPAIAAIQSESPEAAQWKPGDYLQYDLRVAIEDGRIVAFLVAGESEIFNIAVAPSHRRQGLARELLRAFLNDSTEPVFLEVRASNHAARNLYKSLGFEEISVRNSYYQEPPEPAIVMKFHSC